MVIGLRNFFTKLQINYISNYMFVRIYAKNNDYYNTHVILLIDSRVIYNLIYNFYNSLVFILSILSYTLIYLSISIKSIL